MKASDRRKLIANYSLKYFIKMFQEGGTYNELEDKQNKFFKIIEYYFPKSGIKITIPMVAQEYNYWRKIKPSLKQGDKINEKR